MNVVVALIIIIIYVLYSITSNNANDCTLSNGSPCSNVSDKDSLQRLEPHASKLCDGRHHTGTFLFIIVYSVLTSYTSSLDITRIRDFNS